MKSNMVERGILSRYDSRRASTKIAFVLLTVLVIIMVVSMLYPIASTFMNSLKSLIEINSFPPKFFPSDWNFKNYADGWKYMDLPHFLGNTLIIFAGNMAVIIFALGLAAFSLSKLNVPYRKVILLFFLSTLFIPPSTYIVPNFVNLKDLGLLNTFTAFWLPAGASAFYLLLIKTFFDDIHHEMFEAARLDGASEWKCFTRIAFPLSIPIFSTLAIFVFATAWNDWFWPSLVMHGDPNYPLATAIYKKVIDGRVTGLKLNVKFAILSMIMIPPIIVFFIFQKYIMRGLHLGGVKG
jgi:multiple sugar transport system permease protein